MPILTEICISHHTGVLCLFLVKSLGIAAPVLPACQGGLVSNARKPGHSWSAEGTTLENRIALQATDPENVPSPHTPAGSFPAGKRGVVPTGGRKADCDVGRTLRFGRARTHLPISTTRLFSAGVPGQALFAVAFRRRLYKMLCVGTRSAWSRSEPTCTVSWWSDL